MFTLVPTKTTPKYTFKFVPKAPKYTFTFTPKTKTRVVSPAYPFTKEKVKEKATSLYKFFKEALKVVPIWFTKGDYIFFRDPSTGEWHILPKKKGEVIVQKGTILPPEIGEEWIPYSPSEYTFPPSETVSIPSRREYPAYTYKEEHIPKVEFHKGLITFSILAIPIILALIVALRR